MGTAFIGKAKVRIGLYSSGATFKARALRYLENTSRFELSFSEEEKKLADFTNATGGTDASSKRISEVSGALDARLEGVPGLTYIPTLAGPFLAENTLQFDLVVNDMRMEPGLSASIMNSVARFVPFGGLAVMSLKLPVGSPLQVVDSTVATLRRNWETVALRQLFHNRHEITAILRRR